jgi:hypothetical protein
MEYNKTTVNRLIVATMLVHNFLIEFEQASYARDAPDATLCELDDNSRILAPQRVTERKCVSGETALLMKCGTTKTENLIHSTLRGRVVRITGIRRFGCWSCADSRRSISHVLCKSHCKYVHALRNAF